MTEFQAWFLVASAIVSVVAAIATFAGIVCGRRAAKRQATLGFINDYNSDRRVSAAHAVLRMIGDKDAATILEEQNSRDNFLFLMNMFEILASGFKNGMYDEKIIVSMLGRDIREIYDKSAPLIAHIRKAESDGEAFSEFESLAQSIQTRYRL